ncbi:Two-component response regulator-like PRR95 isoform D [Glycine soja]|uniref:Two-component response regulator-like PRR95 isoform D n=1 Tax=Glycine soja TaxID=3848 RepID=A0A445JSI1_GLYSO|nr:Two-component response regulator-like PRR95 isoform D [Glycine soja]
MDELNGAMTTENSNAEVVRWERFLPRMVLRVLLVEADHSTRQIIAALLRKCSYTVIAVPDGLKAWETLKKKAPELDLILTEVELPAISGFALLSLIMEHDICKNIPVIMMSSHDSVSMALKCMLKGAVDFLIKPIRKNELRNLWQHVWRRHAISTPTQNTTFSPKKLKTASEDNSASNKSSGSVASSKKNNECSERLSEAQSTCTSPIFEAESTCVENMQDVPQYVHCQVMQTLVQSTCTSPIFEAKSTYVENMQDVPPLKSSKLNKIDMVKHEKFAQFERESAEHNDETEDKSVTIVSDAARCDKTSELTELRPEQDCGVAEPETENEDEILKSELDGDNSHVSMMQGCSAERVKPSKGAIDLIATVGNLPKHLDENCSLNGGNTTKFDCETQLELSLRSDFPGSSGNQASEATEESQRLNHSNTSAFSWYSNSKLLQPHFSTPSITFPEVNNLSWDSHESHKLSGITSGNCQYGGSNQNLENMIGTVICQYGQVTPKLSNSQCGLLPVSGVISDLKSEGHGNVFTSLFYAQSGIHPMSSPKPVCQNESSPFPTSTSTQSNPESHNSDQLHDCSNDSTCLNQNVKDNTDSDHARHDSPVADQSAGNSLCHDAANHVNSSAYGSMDSGNDGITTSAIVSKNAPDGFSDSGCHNYDGFRVTDPHRSSQREAVLVKFRLKRKERCFEKKVRYQSRKRLAEQRPRVKGQFVRQHDHPVAEAD